MRFLLATTLLLAACGFDHGQLGDERPDAGGFGPGGGGGGTGGGSDTTTPVPRTCRFWDSSVRLCLEFDDGQLPTVHDTSVTPYTDPTATNIQAAMRDTSPAVALATGSLLSVAENMKLDITTAITLELWVNPTTLKYATLINNETQYKLAIDDTGHVSCNAGNAYVYTYDQTIPANKWSHIACTYDGSKMKVYIDGDNANHCANGQQLSTGGMAGTAIAGSLVGSIDEVHIYARAMSTDELCKHVAPDASCQSQCNGG